MTRPWVYLFSFAVVLSACGGAVPSTGRLKMTPPAATTAALVGACKDGVCPCMNTTAPAEPAPAEGTKRFAFRLGSGPGTVWVTLNGSQHMVKTTEVAEACYYVDLAPGKHEVIVQGRARAPSEGAGAALIISEYASGEGGAPWWYDTFVFRCGFPGPCEAESLRAWKSEVDGYARSLRDPCGSTKVRRAAWETGRLPDGAHPDEFVAVVTLDVYPFTPKAGPGKCGSGADEPISDPPDEAAAPY